MVTYTVSQVAKMLQIKRNTVYELIYSGELKAIKISERGLRVSEKALAEFEANHLLCNSKKVSIM